jgi:hypothetical protein
LYQVNVKQTLAERLIGERRGMRLKRAPMLGISPCLVRIEFVKI